MQTRIIKINNLGQAGSTYGHVHEGVYLAVTGPTYETKGESIAFRDWLKADAVGMSCITNVIAADGTNATSHEEVKAILESPEVRQGLLTTVQNFFMLYRDKAGGFF